MNIKQTIYRHAQLVHISEKQYIQEHIRGSVRLWDVLIPSANQFMLSFELCVMRRKFQMM